MTATTTPYGGSLSRGEAHILHHELRLSHPPDRVWSAVASAEGLGLWLAHANPFEPGPGGAVGWQPLHSEAADFPVRTPPVIPGRITAWGEPRTVEYTLDTLGCVRFVLDAESPRTGGGTRLRFWDTVTGDDRQRLGWLARWHLHLEHLDQALSGRTPRWSAERLEELLAEYTRRDGEPAPR
ncbi:hypothetical protein [Streptomyces sp. NPDC005438]|uniref:hypothetical protein n=1 Tax=Streptomyces sp. NPDC005438 TaxID=3156880 RepID=UPI0033BC7346